MQQIIKERYDTKPVLPRGQQLDKLLAQFEAIVMEPYRTHDSADSKQIIRHLNEMRGRHRSVFASAVEKTRPYLRQLWQNPNEPHNRLAAMHNPGWAEQSAEWRECLNATMAYLTSANAGRALLFAVCHGFLLCQGLAFQIEERPGDFAPNGVDPEHWNENSDYLLLMDANNSTLREYFTILWNTPHHEGMNRFVAQCAGAVTMTGACFVNLVVSFGSRDLTKSE